ncbi:MAG: head-tail connector protein [Hyphomicrobiales bacterium]|nr:head-tail connector protein [Hyphomicrobiales bacterium]
MPLILTSGPVAEPVSLAETKAHLRIDGADEDALIGSLIVAARMHIEHALDLALITQNWSLYLDAWPVGPVDLPLGPVQAINNVRLYAVNAAVTTLTANQYQLDAASRPARLAPVNVTWPAPGRAVNGIEIAFTAGYGASGADVPQPLRHAILMLVAHWHEQREAAAPEEMFQQPQGVAALMAPYRTARL